ncbi:MAG: hypothetical protein HZA50_18300 [Planctomycetes bacterium]|nr:hypothetical protein [Planctomycetota bacterium]
MDILRAINGQLIRTPSGELAICGPSDPCSAWINPPEHNPTVMFSVNGVFPSYSECAEKAVEQLACQYALAGAFSEFIPGWPGDGMCTWRWSSSVPGLGDATLEIRYAPPHWYAAHEIIYSTGLTTGYGFLNPPALLPDGAMSIITTTRL